MNLAEWLQGNHEPSQRLKAAQTLCRAVADQGVSVSLDPSRIPVSASGECRPENGRGTPSGRYRAPEISDGGKATPQSQVYTAGVLCFEILAGQPFDARTGATLRDLRPDLPPDLSDAVQACLEKDADWRPKDLSYVLGLVGGMDAAGSASRPPSRGGRTPSAPAPPSGGSRRHGPAPRPWPLLAFALVVLAASLVSAVVRLRQPIEPPSLPPAPSTPPSAAAAGASVPVAERSPVTLAADGSRPTPPSPSPAAVASPAARPRPSPGKTGAQAATPAPVPSAVAAVSAPVSAPPTLPSAEPAAAAVGPAAVTSLSPPSLRRGMTTLVDVHGVNLRREHEVRLARAKDAVRGVEVVRQRYVGPGLVQVLLRVEPEAAPGGYVLYLLDRSGATNTRPLEILR